MERRLILMRHAKSSWSSNAANDHDRPLNKRGKRDAPRIARALAARDWLPEAVWSSSATRTRQTWKRMQKALDAPIEVVFDEAYYHGGLEDIRASAMRWPGDAETMMVVGHNPGWEMALYQLSQVPETMTTCNAALLVGRGDHWRDALHGIWELVDVIRPRELEG